MRLTSHRPSRIRAGVCLLMTATLLTACGSATHRPEVASLPGATSTNGTVLATSGGIPDPDGRPRASLDDTAKQVGALYDPYFACLRAHRYVDQETAQTRTRVAAKCEALEPLPAWQLDPNNPQARAFVGRTVACLDADGYHARADLVTNVPIEPPAWYVEYSPQRVGQARQTQTAQDVCQQKANR